MAENCENVIQETAGADAERRRTYVRRPEETLGQIDIGHRLSDCADAAGGLQADDRVRAAADADPDRPPTGTRAWSSATRWCG